MAFREKVAPTFKRPARKFVECAESNILVRFGLAGP